MLENDEEIVLDETNNVFVGPDGYFKIVIDEFDGETVKAWHIEDAEGNKTANLADWAQGKHIDAFVNGKCRTVSHFASRYSSNIFAFQENKVAQLSAQGSGDAAPVTSDSDAKSGGVPVAVPVVIAVVAVAIIAFQATRNKKA